LVGSIFVLCAFAPAVSNSVTRVVLVAPATGSSLEWDDPQLNTVRTLLLPIINSQPSCLEGKIGDALEHAYADVTESDPICEYHWKVMGGHWVHEIVYETDFVVDLGGTRTIEVAVISSEIKS
jgi:hypothetical protein